MSSTYVYRLLKSAWGIRITITGRADNARSAPEGAAGHGRVSLQFSGTAADLPEDFRAEIAAGLSLVEDAIKEERNGTDVTVTIEEVKFNEADFQVEGLRVAVIRWAEQQFSLPERRINEFFDRSSNRYVFSIS